MMPLIQHSFERWKLKEHLLRFYPHSTPRIEEAHIGELCRSILCHEDEVEILENRLELLNEPEHRNEVLAMYEKDLVVASGLSCDTKQHDLCREILNQKITRVQGNRVLINNALRARPSVSSLAPVSFTTLSPVSLRLIRLLALFLDNAALDKNKEMRTNPHFDETMQRELSLICTVIASEALAGVQRPLRVDGIRADTLHPQIWSGKLDMAHGAEAKLARSVKGGVRKKRRLDNDGVSLISSSLLRLPDTDQAPSTYAPVSQSSDQSGTTEESLNNESTISRLLGISNSTWTSALSLNQASASSSNRSSASSVAPKPSGHTNITDFALSSNPARRPDPPTHFGHNPHPHH